MFKHHVQVRTRGFYYFLHFGYCGEPDVMDRRFIAAKCSEEPSGFKVNSVTTDEDITVL